MTSRVLFFGSDLFSVRVLEGLLGSSQASISCAFSNTRGEFSKFAALIQLRSFILPFPLKKWSLPDSFDLGIIASFGSFIPLRIIHQFTTQTMLNAHPSMLPLYRGAAPIQRSLLDGVCTTGVSIIDCEAREFDAGNIWAQEKLEVGPTDTYGDLVDKAGSVAGRMLGDVVSNFSHYKEQRQAQAGRATFAPKITKQDALIDLKKMTHKQVLDAYRAIFHQEQLQCTGLANRGVILYKLRPELSAPIASQFMLDGSKKLLHLKCSDGISIAGDIFGLSGKSNRFTAHNIYNYLSIHGQ